VSTRLRLVQLCAIIALTIPSARLTDAPLCASFCNMPRLSVPLTDEQHRAIRRKAASLGVPQAEVARRFLLAWALGLLDMPVYREATEFEETIEKIAGGY